MSDARDLIVAFVGLGNMGAPMVRNLAAAGVPLILRDANDAAAGALVRELDAGRPRRAPTSRTPTSS